MSTPAFKRPGTFAGQQAARAKVPPCVVELALACWKDGRPSKPLAPVKVGLRLLSEDDFERASARAAKEAWVAAPEGIPEDVRVEAYNNRLMTLLMAEATCSPTDVGQRYFQHGDLQIGLDLTPDGIRFLWDHYEAMTISASPTSPEATDAELDALADGLATGELLAGLDIEQARRVRRLLKAAMTAAG